jgi:hypothetical protein
MISDISDFYKSKLSDNTVLSFIGELDTGSIDSLLSELEETLNKFDDNIKVRRRIFNVLTELLQNLFHHSDEIQPDDTGKTPSSVCIVNKSDTEYIITSVNYIRNDKVDGFRKKLERINNLTPEELKSYYLEVLDNGEKSDKDGAGLGMIEISRKTGDKLNFEFIKLDDEFSLFILNTKILK